MTGIDWSREEDIGADRIRVPLDGKSSAAWDREFLAITGRMCDEVGRGLYKVVLVEEDGVWIHVAIVAGSRAAAVESLDAAAAAANT